MLASEQQRFKQITAWLSAKKTCLTDATGKLDEAVRKISDRQESATSGRSLLRFNDRNVGLRLDRNT